MMLNETVNVSVKIGISPKTTVRLLDKFNELKAYFFMTKKKSNTNGYRGLKRIIYVRKWVKTEE